MIGENSNWCPEDCRCGDGVCDPQSGEHPGWCASDCFCGDGYCDRYGYEDPYTCPQDCSAAQDGICDAGRGETSPVYPGAFDCRYGDGICDWYENRWDPWGDCFCGDGLCSQELGETPNNCPGDCQCGNGICDVNNENRLTCPSDCRCGDGRCDSTEQGGGCPSDCGDYSQFEIQHSPCVVGPPLSRDYAPDSYVFDMCNNHMPQCCQQTWDRSCVNFYQYNYGRICPVQPPPPQPSTGKPYAYVRCDSQPWGSTSNEQAMDMVFGVGNWSDLRFSTVDPSALFSGGTSFVFLEGSDGCANQLDTFLQSHLGLIENWVLTGKGLFLNAAPNVGGNINFGFGGVTLIYPDFGDSGTAWNTGHPIWNGPWSAPLEFSGNSYAHASIQNNSPYSVEPIILDTWDGSYDLVELHGWNGRVMFGGLTTANWWSPQPQSQNLRANIIAYLAGLW
jgi:hypothetical protein